MRHEKFNGKMKEFWLMQVKFRSPYDENFAPTFKAIVVLVEYRLEHWGSFLYVLAGIEMEE